MAYASERLITPRSSAGLFGQVAWLRK